LGSSNEVPAISVARRGELSPTIEDVSEPDVTDSCPVASPVAPQSPELPAKLRGVITDWGGVLTNPIIETVTVWLENEGIDRTSYRNVMRSWVAQAYDGGAGTNPIRALERGECTEADFERQLAEQLLLLDGGPVAADRLLERMFAATVLDQAMTDLIRSARQAGLRTGLLSNSWGVSYGYPRHLFPELFDAVVISAEVGMRKPEERIFLLATELIGLEPAECVFIDDIEENVAAARAAGLIGVHHTTARETAEQLTTLLGVAF
jgi:putative hydrolase of the HAD superfamily